MDGFGKFGIRIPFLLQFPSVRGESAMDSGFLHGKKLLAVDDEADVLEIFKEEFPRLPL